MAPEQAFRALGVEGSRSPFEGNDGEGILESKKCEKRIHDRLSNSRIYRRFEVDRDRLYAEGYLPLIPIQSVHGGATGSLDLSKVAPYFIIHPLGVVEPRDS